MFRNFIFLMPLVLAFSGCVSYKTPEISGIPGSSATDVKSLESLVNGGRGGRIIKVTNLNSDGEGSLKAALEAKGPRIVVFEAGGIIDLKKNGITVTNGNLTVAGETAPSPGITIIRGSLMICAPNVIVRHIRIRTGDGGDLRTPKWDADAMSAVGPDARNILFDQCSTAWGNDENLSVSGPRVKNGTAANVTIKNCIIAEGLDYSTHAKGPHSMGTLIHDFCRNVALIGNFYAHNCKRNPYIKPNATVYMANNLIYDPVYAAAHFVMPANEYRNIKDPMLRGELTAYGNVVRLGLFSPTQLSLFKGKGKLYAADNYAYTRKGALLWGNNKGALWGLKDHEVFRVKHPMLKLDGFKPLPGNITEKYVLKNAGCRPKDRDCADRRLVSDYLERKGGIIDSQDEVGGYPEACTAYRKLKLPEKKESVEAWLKKYRDQVEY